MIYRFVLLMGCSPMLSFAVDFNQRIDKCPALPDSSVGFNPFQLFTGQPFIKGAKAHRGRGFAFIFINRQLKQTAKESLRHEASLVY